MKKLGILLGLLVACFALAACGGHTDHGNGNDHDDNHGNECGHGHGDDHTGEHHELGDFEENGWKISVEQIGHADLGKEAIIEVRVTQDGKTAKDVVVSAFIGDANGDNLEDAGEPEWMADESAWDVHMRVPKEMPAGSKLWVEILKDGKRQIKGSFDLEQDED